MTLLSTSSLGSVKTWRIAPVARLVGYDVSAAERARPWIAPDGKRVARNVTDGIDLWNTTTGDRIAHLGTKTWFAVAGPDHLYARHDDVIESIDADTGTVSHSIHGPFAVDAMCVDRQSSSIVVAHATSIAALDATGKSLAHADLPAPSDLLCSPGGVIATAPTGVTTVLEVPSLHPLVPPLSVFLMPAAAEANGFLFPHTRTELEVWRGGKMMTTLKHPVAPVSTYSRADALYVGLVDGSVVEWDPATWKQRAIIRAHQGPIFAIAGDDHFLATVSTDQVIRIWDRTFRHAIAQVRADAISWLGLFGSELLTASPYGVFVRELGTRSLSPTELSGIACKVPVSVREQSGSVVSCTN